MFQTRPIGRIILGSFTLFLFSLYTLTRVRRTRRKHAHEPHRPVRRNSARCCGVLLGTAHKDAQGRPQNSIWPAELSKSTSFFIWSNSSRRYHCNRVGNSLVSLRIRGVILAYHIVIERLGTRGNDHVAV